MNERINIDPALCNGKPVVKGTRISVQSILEYLAAGDSAEDIIEAFPKLKPEDITACLEYASQLLSNRFTLEPVG